MQNSQYQAALGWGDIGATHTRARARTVGVNVEPLAKLGLKVVLAFAAALVGIVRLRAVRRCSARAQLVQEQQAWTGGTHTPEKKEEKANDQPTRPATTRVARTCIDEPPLSQEQCA